MTTLFSGGLLDLIVHINSYPVDAWLAQVYIQQIMLPLLVVGIADELVPGCVRDLVNYFRRPVANPVDQEATEVAELMEVLEWADDADITDRVKTITANAKTMSESEAEFYCELANDDNWEPVVEDNKPVLWTGQVTTEKYTVDYGHPIKHRKWTSYLPECDLSCEGLTQDVGQ